MLPGQVGLLLIGIISALALCVLGAFSYLAFSKEKKQKARGRVHVAVSNGMRV